MGCATTLAPPALRRCLRRRLNGVITQVLTRHDESACWPQEKTGAGQERDIRHSLRVDQLAHSHGLSKPARKRRVNGSTAKMLEALVIQNGAMVPFPEKVRWNGLAHDAVWEQPNSLHVRALSLYQLDLVSRVKLILRIERVTRRSVEGEKKLFNLFEVVCFFVVFFLCWSFSHFFIYLIFKKILSLLLLFYPQ